VTTQQETDERRRLERAREIALFRYSLIQEVISSQLTAAQRGRRVRELAAVPHPGPGGTEVRVSYQTINRWKRDYLAGGFEALVPAPRQASPRTPGEVLALAAALKRENLERTAAQVQRILRATSGWAPSDRTLQRLFSRLELNCPVGEDSQRVFGRFEAARPNELWTGDALHGPVIGGRKTYLFCFIDDYSRAVMGARWAFHEDVVRLAAALRPALAVRGVPESAYVDNGSAFADAWLLRACAVLGIKLVHSRPGRPQGRGKVERFFRTVRDQFLVELGSEDRQAGTRAADLAELNRLFAAWVEVSYHRAVHSETGQAPLARWAAGVPQPLPLPSPAQLHEAFLWSERRTVRKTATVSLHGNLYQVDASLVRCVVELVFDPFDLTILAVRCDGKDAGTATPHHITRHAHPKARPEEPGTGDDAPRATGIDYLALLGEQHDRQDAGRVNYAALAGARPGSPGQQEQEQQEEEGEGSRG
jgi:putative transposase